MEQTQPSRLSPVDRRATAQRFAAWLRDRMTERDYDLSQRGGGQAALAQKTGLGRTTISRLLGGTAHNPDPESLRAIAEALALPFGELLIRAGVLTAEELHAVQESPPSDHASLTVDTAAAALDITDPIAVQMFEAGIEAARALQRKRLDRERAE